MTKSIIVIIDDKDHAIKQIKRNFPHKKLENYTIIHFDSYAAFEKSSLDEIYIIFLDFFLDIDRKHGTHFIPVLKSEYFVGFSSMKETTLGLAQKAKESNRWHENKVFAIQKLKQSLENKELKKLLEKII